MEAPISASVGAMGSLLEKLKDLAIPSIYQLIADLCVVQDRLVELSKVRDPSLTANYWMKDVRELSYDIEDYIDLSVNADAGAKMDWNHTISGFLTRAKEANDRWSIYNLDPGSSPTNMIVSHHFPTVLRKSVHLVGMNGPRNKLLAWIAEDEEKFKVLCILGVEGIGKTTLVEELWRELDGKFECRAFVQTAKRTDIKMTLRSILSQVRPFQPAIPCSVPNLIDDVKKHLKNRRYFIIVDDLWAPSVWDVVRHAFPENNCGSRIITTTKIDEVALACCVYNPQYTFKMKALSVDDSKKLLISRTFGSGKYPGQFHEVLHEIARKCYGSPLAIIIMGSFLAIKQETVQNLEDKLRHWQYVQKFLCNNLRVNPTSDEIFKPVLNLCYNSFPSCLKTCLLYLSVYPDNYILLKEDLVNQWVAEDFICSSTQENAMEVATSYFNKLVNLGLIECRDIKHKADLLTYTVHHIVHDFITRKAQEENFVRAIDYSQTTIRLSDKVHRLSLHFGSATYATTPANIGLSQIRSFIFIGLFNCMPSIKEFKLLRVATLHFSCDDGNMIDLTEIYQLILLRYLQVNCNVTVKLPDQMQCLKHLETLEINANDKIFPSNILHLSLLQLQFQGMPNQPNLTMDPSASHTTTPVPPVQTLDLLPSPCIFSGIPEWISQLRELRILKIVVSEFLTRSINILTELRTLAVLSLYVLEPTAKSIVFKQRTFSALVFLEFRCRELRLEFEEGAMPNLQRLYLVLNAHKNEEYGYSALSGLEHLRNLKDVTARIGAASGASESDMRAAESVCKNAIAKHPYGPTFKVVEMVDQVQEADHLDRQKENYDQDGSSSKQYRIQRADLRQAIEIDLGQTIKRDLEDTTNFTVNRTFQATDPPKSSQDPKSGDMAEAVMLVVSKIGSVLVEEVTFAVITKLSKKITNLKELPVKVKEIGNELNMMNNFIKRISTTDLMDFVKAWIAEVRELAHYVEDVLDKYSYHALKLDEDNSVKKFFAKANYIKVFSEIADEITQIEGKIKIAVKWKDELVRHFELTPYPLADVRRKGSRDCLLELVQNDLVGVEDNRKQLTEWLYSDEQGNTVITVSGMGGLGKTTLVANVYEREKSNFNISHWIVVSPKYDGAELLRKMLRKIWSLEHTQLEDLDAHDLKSVIKEKLKDSKCLVVLDNVWNREAYTQIGDAFQNHKASRIIITTRQYQVASLANMTRQLKLLPLKHSDAFDLLCRKAFFNSMGCKCPQELEKLANDIVDRCQGLPLAIVSIGGMLSSMPPTHYVWNETYKQLRSELANNNHVGAILNLIYQDLPGELRNCFLYCSLFPEDHQLPRETLVRLWVAEGFAVQKEENTPEEVAERYLRELIQRKMLEVLESDELGRVRTCKMHDLVRDLALHIAKHEKFGFANDFDTMIETDREVRRLSSCEWKDKTVLKVKFLRLRTLVALGMTTSSPQMLSSILSESSYLTVLELQDSDITEVPASIGNLFNLRYIGLQRTRVKSLPDSIGKLSRLHTLNIKQTKIQKLPRGIVKVKKLRHLLADRYEIENKSEFQYFKGVQAPKDLSNLEELQTLETVEASKDLAEQLTKLMQLRSLWIDNISCADCANLFATLSKMPLLSSLLLSASHENETLCLDALKPRSENLHRLIVRGCWAAGTLECPIFRDHGKYLKYLAISWCRLQEDPLLLLASHVPNLTYLSLNRVSTPSALVLSAGCFPQLKTLALKCMPDVNYLEIIDGALQHIEGLYVVSLPKLDIVPQGIESLRYLKRLWLLGLHKNFRSRWEKNGMHQKMQHVPELRVKD